MKTIPEVLLLLNNVRARLEDDGTPSVSIAAAFMSTACAILRVMGADAATAHALFSATFEGVMSVTRENAKAIGEAVYEAAQERDSAPGGALMPDELAALE